MDLDFTVKVYHQASRQKTIVTLKYSLGERKDNLLRITCSKYKNIRYKKEKKKI